MHHLFDVIFDVRVCDRKVSNWVLQSPSQEVGQPRRQSVQFFHLFRWRKILFSVEKTNLTGFLGRQAGVALDKTLVEYQNKCVRNDSATERPREPPTDVIVGLIQEVISIR
jgi:hypothetical protein